MIDALLPRGQSRHANRPGIPRMSISEPPVQHQKPIAAMRASRKKRIKPPERQISVTLYEWLVIRSYRATLRPLSSWAVKQYSLEAVHKHGLPKGVWLTLKRFGRDMPGISDPSPDFDARLMISIRSRQKPREALRRLQKS